MTISHLEKNNIKIAGFVFVGEELPHTWDIIKKTLGLPLLFRVPIFNELNKNTIVNFVKEIDGN